MPNINVSLIPTITPGDLLTKFTTDTTLNIRWLTALDPVYFEALNRPLADVTVRQLILAKALDNLSSSLGNQALFPYIVQPQVEAGTTVVDVPLGWIWDIHVSMPKKWEKLRLAKIKRISGDNSTTNGYNGKLRLIFTASQESSSTEVAVFSADYDIDSSLTYQIVRIEAVTSLEEATSINPGETETIAGFIIFKTLNADELIVTNFYDLVAPPTDTTDSDSDGLYDDPAVYEIVDSVAGGVNITDDFSSVSTSHGTGMLTSSALNSIPPLDSDIQSWILSFNYPFDSTATRTSVNSITIPNGLFKEFNICAPAGDEPSGDTTGLYFPVWISRIERIGTTSNQLRFYFSTHNTTESETGGTPSLEPVEFASMDLLRSYSEGEIVAIEPLIDLKLKDEALWGQHFGRGHVVLSSLWGGTTSEVDDFFDAFDSIVTSPADTDFNRSATRISAFGISRVPKYSPTVGQARALLGSTSKLSTPIDPGYDNAYVCEQDQGLGDQIDLDSQTGITSNAAIDRYGYTGALCHRVVKLVIDQTQISSDPDFYTNEILPRLTVLLGRPPIFGDVYFNGTRFLTFNGDSWQS